MLPQNMITGVQDITTQHMLLWAAEDFELEAQEKQQRQEEVFSELPSQT